MEIARRGALASALLAWSLAACAAPELPRTEIVVVVDTDLGLGDELDALRIEISGPGADVRSSGATLDAASALPQTLGLVHERGALGPIHVLAVGLLGDQEVLRREAELSFLADKTLALPMHLVRACMTHSCGAEQTCSENGCVAIDVDATRLAEWHGQPPTLTEPSEPLPGDDAGTPDAGQELDAAAEPDAETDPDAGVPEQDASEDAAMCMPRVESCNEQDDDCDGVVDNGYDLATDTRHCGVCNNRCSAPTAICCNGSCARNCPK